MQELKLALVESKFADIIWQYEPVKSGELVKICERIFRESSLPFRPRCVIINI